MNSNIKRDLGQQPIAQIIAKYKLKPHDIAAASIEQMTHKMITRAVKGRRLTSNVKFKILNALNKAAGKNFSLNDLFNY